ncbi:MAG: hypothetical protein AAGC46_21295, partial [Solirubrobacteraceae bacterium]
MPAAAPSPSLSSRARRAMLVVVAALVGALGLTAQPAAAYPVPGPEFVGINTQGTVKDTSIAPGNWGRYFDQLSAGQMNIAR